MRWFTAPLTVALLAAAPSALAEIGSNGAGDFLDLRVAVTPLKAGSTKAP